MIFRSAKYVLLLAYLTLPAFSMGSAPDDFIKKRHRTPDFSAQNAPQQATPSNPIPDQQKKAAQDQAKPIDDILQRLVAAIDQTMFFLNTIIHIDHDNTEIIPLKESSPEIDEFCKINALANIALFAYLYQEDQSSDQQEAIDRAHENIIAMLELKKALAEVFGNAQQETIKALQSLRYIQNTLKTLKGQLLIAIKLIHEARPQEQPKQRAADQAQNPKPDPTIAAAKAELAQPPTELEEINDKLIDATIKGSPAADIQSRLIKTGTPCRKLFVGPPGTGKTTIAKVIAKSVQIHRRKNEQPLPVIFCLPIRTLRTRWQASVPEVLKFTLDPVIQKKKPDSDIIVIFDEIDSMDRNPDHFMADSKTLGDYIEECKDVSFFATANYPDLIEPTLAKRLGESIAVDLPNLELRTLAFEYQLNNQHNFAVAKDCKNDKNVHAELARATEGLVIRDIVMLIGNAKEIAINREKPGEQEITKADILACLEILKKRRNQEYWKEKGQKASDLATAAAKQIGTQLLYRFVEAQARQLGIRLPRLRWIFGTY